MTAHQRKPLPNRRFSETRRVETPHGHRAFISVGYDPSNPMIPREVFYCEGFKSGSDLEYHMQDMCVLISLLLQYDMSPSDIAKSLSRRKTELGGMAYASLVGWVIDVVQQPPQWAASSEEPDNQADFPGGSDEQTEAGQ